MAIKAWQRQEIGEILIIVAMQRTLLFAENAGMIGLFVDPKAYDERYGFVNLDDIPLEPFLPLAPIKQFLQPR